MDFVYRVKAWEFCHKACALMLSSRRDIARLGAAMLADFRQYGLLSEEHVKRALSQVRHSAVAQQREFQAQLDMIEANLAEVMGEIHLGLSKGTGAEQNSRALRIWEGTLKFVEALLDCWDAMKRRSLSEEIYSDLVAQRISRKRAAEELRILHQRQEGGWLVRRWMEK